MVNSGVSGGMMTRPVHARIGGTFVNVTACNNVSSGGFMVVMFLACARAVAAFRSFGGVGGGLDFLGIGSASGKGGARVFPIAKETW